MTERKVKAIGLISGGLDSLLAAKVLQDQNIDVLGISFATPFWDCEMAVRAATEAGIPIRVVDISHEHLEIVKNPRYGYGSNMNPCIDCHGLMLRVAGRIMEEEGADFIFTGEVLGQRPMSQRRDALRSVEKLSRYEGIILRPLSAKLLPETEPEKKGLVDREKLLAIRGRSRKEQMKLAETYGLKTYATPAGGCLLTKEGFSRKLKKLLEIMPDAEVRHIEMIKSGRLCVIGDRAILFVGRNAADNKRLDTLTSSPEEIRLKVLGIPGPRGILCGGYDNDRIELAASIVAAFSDADPDDMVTVELTKEEGIETVTVKPIDRRRIDTFLVR
ncbi:tRNA 4-thiouridine(8) synthase ThiI [Thermodesulforhabdus norvegica]|uniref:tRNA U34 2-thiouridine synthase MnmA/TrmU, contains the PP-loop ATPase domain n=1 Tax=Thermodesulforhabdus norvegica TaxID=39841 RepID=A0A1I4ULR4_9BACT|nr:tRNA 4-thiouridine(8) synthase ThiI [Thermodesulforhabdus norvegica]SFM89643.1 tRNA U34 2-thiouridine synthase MnmA/TrmU, contains the PP-loop ATPase domain [Thermodesulforhabdus norvegica]